MAIQQPNKRRGACSRQSVNGEVVCALLQCVTLFVTDGNGEERSFFRTVQTEQGAGGTWD
jgi:hypothetical protein